MAFIKRFAAGVTPTQAQLTALEGVYIAQKNQPLQVAGLGRKVVVVGEAVNDRGMPKVARQLQSMGELDSYYGGFSANIGSETDGFEGNLYVALYPTRFSPLPVIVVPDLEAGEVTFSGTTSTDGKFIPAGTVVSDGGTSLWMTLEDISVSTPTYAGSWSVRVRHLSGASTAGMGVIDTIVPAMAGWTVTNAATCTAVSLETAYEDAIEVTLDQTTPAGDATLIFACRHTAAIHTALRTNADDASAAGRGRIAVLAPPIGTSQVTAFGSTTVGVGVSRADRYAYGFPGVQWLFTQYDSEVPIVVPFDSALAQTISLQNPFQSPGQVTGALNYLLGTEDTIILNRAYYEAAKAAGVCSLNIDRSGRRCVYSAVTTSLTQFEEPIEQRTAADQIQDDIANFLAEYKDKPLDDSTKDGMANAIDTYLEGLKKDGSIVEYITDDVSLNTPANEALGIWTILVRVKRTPAAKYIVLTTQIGTSVSVSQSA